MIMIPKLVFLLVVLFVPRAAAFRLPESYVSSFTQETSNNEPKLRGSHCTNDNAKMRKSLHRHLQLPYIFTQLGADIDGEETDDNSGWSVSLSADGRTVAVGAPGSDGNGNESGHVRVFTFGNGSGWSQLGDDIDGEAASDSSGTSVSLSADGRTVAIGAPVNDGNGPDSGHVRVYSYSTGIGWSQLGADVDGEKARKGFGRSLSLSSDGRIVAIGGGLGYSRPSAYVRVYSYSPVTGWSQLGSDIDAEKVVNNFGRSVSLSSDGRTLAISDPTSGLRGIDGGPVRVYSYSSEAGWFQRGGDIDGEAAFDHPGRSLSLSTDGRTVAVGATGNDGNGNESGHVRVFSFNSESGWSQIGDDIDGEAAGDSSGWSVSLSGDGRTVAIGAPFNDENGLNSGHVRVYSYSTGIGWSQLGADIDGDEAGNLFGFSVSLSANGRTLAFGFYDSYESEETRGHVRIYDLVGLPKKKKPPASANKENQKLSRKRRDRGDTRQRLLKGQT